MKTIIIDGNNLLHKIPHLKNLFLKDKESAQVSLIETIRSRLNKNEKAIFVFDGHGSVKKSGVTFSNDVTADELIRKKIEAFEDHKKLKVISSDNNISGLAKTCGAEVQRSEDFWNELNRTDPFTKGKNINQNYLYDKDDKEKPKRMNKREAEEFKKYFT
ncbi:MAG: NYN domain-containing protein [Ignavibacteria bacterium]